ncbi:BACON domain-containing protein [Robertkochia solimangrovi]|uniref:BACON domain-containing protein n=1 Tax=Robertkochia solimangrovi TaxID=2213046 RepID=UPI001180ACCA|nr:BACON domain-containing protein [Robertkochia solimangrovi]TRZ45713.1 hypothetical protein DMZ48_00070 [Robertkochia solimangrovi]
MNLNRILTRKMSLIVPMLLCLSFTLGLVSCSDDDSFSEAPYFSIEGAPTGLSADVNGITQRYVVRSNRPWKIVGQDENTWVTAFPDEGADDGIFKFIVSKNDGFEARATNFAFIVDGEEQPTLFRIEQDKNVPYLTIPDAGSGITIASAGGEFGIAVNANVEWTYKLSDDSWLSQVEVSEDEIRLLADANIGEERTVLLTLSAPGFPELEQEVTIVQSPGNVILEENFSWLTYGSAVPYETSGETRYDTWTQEEKDHGWYSTPNEVSSGQQIVYARQGFVKLGKTNYGGDLISPKMNIDGTVTLKVTFKAAAYISKGGNIDDRLLNISSLGAGDVSVSQFTIDNVPNAGADDDAGIENDIWAEDRAYEFTITGATSETQIRFLGGDFDLRGIGQGKNRIFLDDIKVEIIN